MHVCLTSGHVPVHACGGVCGLWRVVSVYSRVFVCVLVHVCCMCVPRVCTRASVPSPCLDLLVPAPPPPSWLCTAGPGGCVCCPRRGGGRCVISH